MFYTNISVLIKAIGMQQNLKIPWKRLPFPVFTWKNKHLSKYLRRHEDKTFGERVDLIFFFQEALMLLLLLSIFSQYKDWILVVAWALSHLLEEDLDNARKIAWAFYSRKREIHPSLLPVIPMEEQGQVTFSSRHLFSRRQGARSQSRKENGSLHTTE